MPKSRSKTNAKRPIAPIPLLDSLRAQSSRANSQRNDSESDVDNNAKVLAADWECDLNDWSERKSSKTSTDEFPMTIRSLERKNEQAKNNYFLDNEKEQLERMKTIDLMKLCSIVSNLITGKQDQLAYTEFLAILQQYSVRLTREDHLEETVYHLIQSGVSFIRSNEHRFDPLKLQECYRERHLRRMNSAQ